MSGAIRLGRLTHVARVLMRSAGRELLARVGRPAPPAPERLRQALEELGGTFIKLGQMLALQPDVLPREFCNALFGLLDRVAPLSPEVAAAVIRRELAAEPLEIFDRFEAEPIAAASIGQVHEAQRAGRKLAVKVQRPSTDADFAGDILLMRLLVRAVRRLRLASLEWLADALGEFVDWTSEELDYLQEARYMEALGRGARDNPRERVPEVVWELTTSRVLVVEFLDGVPLVEHLRDLEAGTRLWSERLRRLSFEPEAFATAVVENFLSDVFRRGVYHADLHPANLLVLQDGVVGYVDFGISGTLSGFSRRALIEMTRAYTRGDLEAMCEAFYRVARFGAGADVAAFRQRLEELSVGWFDRSEGRVRLKRSFTIMMLEMTRASRATKIWPQREVLKYVRSVIAIDGLITRFAPDFDLQSHIERFCAHELRSHVVAGLLSPRRVADSSVALGRLLREGPDRLDARLAARRSEPAAPLAAGPDPLPAAAAALVLIAWVSFGAEPGPLGINSFSAQLAVAAGALLVALRDLVRT